MIDEYESNGEGDEREANGSSRAGDVIAMLAAVGAGAALMYLLDPDRGVRRRAMLRDRMGSTLRSAEERLVTTRRDLANRARGRLAETRARLTPEDVDDQVIVGRVRAELGHHVSHPGSIEVTSEAAVVTLAGPVLADEVDRVVEVTRKVRGVREVLSQLEVHQDAGSLPGLQGGAEASTAR